MGRGHENLAGNRSRCGGRLHATFVRAPNASLMFLAAGTWPAWRTGRSFRVNRVGVLDNALCRARQTAAAGENGKTNGQPQIPAAQTMDAWQASSGKYDHEAHHQRKHEHVGHLGEDV